MDKTKLDAYIELAKQYGVTSLRYETDAEKFFVSFAQNNQPLQNPKSENLAPHASSPSSSGSNNKSEEIEASNLIEVIAPFVGTFYRAPMPDAAPFVKEGDKVTKGQVLCILEAMKIMNEIKADVDGRVVEVCRENGVGVEYGNVLFKILPGQ